nr:zinc dependent phospholipase C family protein [uncultured Pseudodesulfovibrio sp.]
MPKELIHFKTALRTAEILSGTRFSSSLDTHPHGLLLGAVVHDVLFYGVNKHARPLTQLAHQLHGIDGQDTFTLLKLQAEHAARTPKNELAIALFVGMASHIFADATMHPMVWYLSGDYFDTNPQTKSQTRQRHRALESLMDMVICPEMIGRPLFSIKRLLTRLENDLYNALPMKSLAKLAGTSPEGLCTGLHHAFTVFATLQGLYPNSTLSRTLFSMSPFLPRQAREIITLFYAPQLMIQAERVRGQIEYQHPVTGESLNKSIKTMMEEAAAKTSLLCQSMEKTLFLGKPFRPKDIGPSLDSGEPGLTTRHMQHFANPSFPQLP